MNALTNILIRLLNALLVGRLAYSSTAGLVIANLIPPAGILFLGWDIGMVISVYLIEFLVMTFYICLHMLTVPADAFPGRFPLLFKILFPAAVFLFVAVFITPFLFLFTTAMDQQSLRYCAESSAGMMIGYGLSFIRNARRGCKYHFEYYLQLIGPRFIYFMIALGGGYALNMRFAAHSGILMLLPVAAAKTLMDYTYERSSFLKMLQEGFRIRE